MIFGHIGEAALHQPLDDVAHFRDMFGGARLKARAQAAERVHVGMKLLLGLFGDLADRLVQRQTRKITRGALVDLVVDIRDVADVGDMVVAIDVAQQPEQDVEHDDRAGVADWAKS